MKILHVVPTYFPATRYGGPIYSVHGLCRALVEAGHEVHVFTTNVDGDQNSQVPVYEAVELDGVKIWYYPSPYGRRLYYSAGMMKALRQRIQYYDLVHLHSVYLWPTWAAARTARRGNLPYLISPRGMLVKDLVRRKSRWLKTVWLNLIEKKNIEHASGLHTTSETEARALEEFNFKLPAVFNVPNGIDSPQPYKTSDISDDVKQVLQQSSYVLYLGRLNWKKGLDRLINTWKDVAESHLVIAGNDEDSYLETLQALATASDVNDRVTFLPRSIDGADKEALFEGASLFVLPSYSENFGNTVLEAMIRGIPVVVTPEVGAAEVIRNAGAGLIVDGDPKVMATAIRGLLNDEQQVARMGLAGKGAAESDYSWLVIGERMEQVYRSILGLER